MPAPARRDEQRLGESGMPGHEKVARRRVGVPADATAGEGAGGGGGGGEREGGERREEGGEGGAEG